MSARTTPGQMAQGADNFYDAPEYGTALDESSANPVDAQELAVREQEWRSELAKLEEEIATLKSVLDAKVFEASELKRKLGITPLVELKEDLKHGVQVLRESETVQKTNAAFKSFGAFASKKFGDLRNSNMFKSVEEKVGGAYHTVKDQISGATLPESDQEEGFETALRSEVGSQPPPATSVRYMAPPSNTTPNAF